MRLVVSHPRDIPSSTKFSFCLSPLAWVYTEINSIKLQETWIFIFFHSALDSSFLNPSVGLTHETQRARISSYYNSSEFLFSLSPHHSAQHWPWRMKNIPMTEQDKNIITQIFFPYTLNLCSVFDFLMLEEGLVSLKNKSTNFLWLGREPCG